MSVATFLLVSLFVVTAIESATCPSDGKNCNLVFQSNAFKDFNLSQKCGLFVFFIAPQVLTLDPTVQLNTPVRIYCPKSCSASCSQSPTTVPAQKFTTTATSFKLTAAPFRKTSVQDSTFKTLMAQTRFSSSASNGLSRYEKYNATRTQIKAHNSLYAQNKSKFKMAVNKFSVATENEMPALKLLLPDITFTTVEPMSPRKRRQTVNETVDWRSWLTPILDQGTCGACWAFSLIGMLEGFFALRNVSTPCLAVQQLISCNTAVDSTYRVANRGCNGGYFQAIQDFLSQVAASYLQSTGLRSASAIPFVGSEPTCSATRFSASAPKILSFDTGYLSNVTSIVAINKLEQRVRRGPVAVGMAVSTDLYSYESGIYDGPCGNTINHAVVLVGFTSTYWIIRNSWGSNWGENGYIRILRTPGFDRCKLYSYWAQASVVGSYDNATQGPVGLPGHNYIVNDTLGATESSTSSSKECCGGECCDSEEDEDCDEEDYEAGYFQLQMPSSSSFTTIKTTPSIRSTSSVGSTESRRTAKLITTTTTATRKMTTTRKTVVQTTPKALRTTTRNSKTTRQDLLPGIFAGIGKKLESFRA
ncbi:unnamed protein product [Caenorhabditis auriculariae]|uniref:Peptidase C1A papain C-terminal domain-containing protein n=1 Tax=Caenorhabditis auriculariae TaxID=2777116 RepID=A0A8S1HFC6_9PELO|nr:unnamed protein product [Caenorhabditis auriculariae]